MAVRGTAVLGVFSRGHNPPESCPLRPAGAGRSRCALRSLRRPSLGCTRSAAQGGSSPLENSCVRMACAPQVTEGGTLHTPHPAGSIASRRPAPAPFCSLHKREKFNVANASHSNTAGARARSFTKLVIGIIFFLTKGKALKLHQILFTQNEGNADYFAV